MLGLEGEEIHQSNAGWSPVYVEDNLGVMSIGKQPLLFCNLASLGFNPKHASPSMLQATPAHFACPCISHFACPCISHFACPWISGESSQDTSVYALLLAPGYIYLCCPTCGFSPCAMTDYAQ